ncbi:transposable element Tcb2 transposase [Trichonephila clavipes]|nr:transposable element Tcb2 transposase [Trichonephila clavipes]
MVWAGIMINGRKRLHVVANGTMTGQRYIDEVLLPHVRLFRGAVGDKFVFMDDNATCHRTLADALGRQVAGQNYPPTNKNTLIRALTEEWDNLPQQLLDNVVQSMRILIFSITTLVTDLVNLNHVQVTSSAPELLTTPPRQQEDLESRWIHRASAPYIRRVCSGTSLELKIRRSRVCDLDR